MHMIASYLRPINLVPVTDEVGEAGLAHLAERQRLDDWYRP